jgi:hypothetical protein
LDCRYRDDVPPISHPREPIESIYRNETALLADSASALLGSMPPRQALRSWLESFLDYMATKNGMADALPAILANRDGLRSPAAICCGMPLAGSCRPAWPWIATR